MFRIKDITTIAFFTAILFVQEQLLTFLPNVQLTVFLIVLYSKVFGLPKTLIIVLIHTILDNIIMSSFSFYYFPFMLLGWSMIPIIVCTLLKKTENALIIAIVGAMCSFIYCWSFVIPTAIFTNASIIAYLIGDITFEIILAISSFLSILWLYNPCYKLLIKLFN